MGPVNNKARLDSIVEEFDREYHRIDRLYNKKLNVAIIGVGRDEAAVGHNVAYCLDKNPYVDKLILSNRTKSRAEHVQTTASKADVYDFNNLEEWINEVDIAIISVGEFDIDREAELKNNASIVADLAKRFKNYNGKTLIFTNPVETITYLFASESGLNPYSIMGVNQIDKHRAINILMNDINEKHGKKLKREEIDGLEVLGGHLPGCMLPTLDPKIVRVGGWPLSSFIPKEAAADYYDNFKKKLSEYGDNQYTSLNGNLIDDIDRAFNQNKDAFEKLLVMRSQGKKITKKIIDELGGSSVIETFKQFTKISAGPLAGRAADEVINAIGNDTDYVSMAVWNSEKSCYAGWPVRFKNMVYLPKDLGTGKIWLEDYEKTAIPKLKEGLANLRELKDSKGNKKYKKRPNTKKAKKERLFKTIDRIVVDVQSKLENFDEDFQDTDEYIAADEECHEKIRNLLEMRKEIRPRVPSDQEEKEKIPVNFGRIYAPSRFNDGNLFNINLSSYDAEKEKKVSIKLLDENDTIQTISGVNFDNDQVHLITDKIHSERTLEDCCKLRTFSFQERELVETSTPIVLPVNYSDFISFNGNVYVAFSDRRLKGKLLRVKPDFSMEEIQNACQNPIDLNVNAICVDKKRSQILASYSKQITAVNAFSLEKRARYLLAPEKLDAVQIRGDIVFAKGEDNTFMWKIGETEPDNPIAFESVDGLFCYVGNSLVTVQDNRFVLRNKSDDGFVKTGKTCPIPNNFTVFDIKAGDKMFAALGYDPNENLKIHFFKVNGQIEDTQEEFDLINPDVELRYFLEVLTNGV